MKRNLLIALAFLISAPMFSQGLRELLDSGTYEYDEIVNMLGVPDSCVHNGYGDDFYHYGKCVIQIGTPEACGMEGVEEVRLEDSSLAILKEIDGVGLRVGDPFSKLKDLAPEYCLDEKNDSVYEIRLCPECDWESYHFTVDEKGIISEIYIWIKP